MKLNSNEYIQYYLTDFEWLILFSLLQKPKEKQTFISLFFPQEIKQQLQSILPLNCLDIQIHGNTSNPTEEGTKIEVSCKDISELETCLANYLQHYKNEKIVGTGDSSLKYRQSMKSTLNLLEIYKRRNEPSITIQREIEGEQDNIFSVDGNSRIFEDLFLLAQYGIINIIGLKYTYTLPRHNVRPKIIVSITISFASIMGKTDTLFIPPQLLIESSSNPTASLPYPYNQFEIKRTNPADVSSERIYHNGKELELMPNKQEYRLLHLLVRFARPISYVDIVKNIPFRPHHDQDGFLPDSNRELEQRFIKNLKNYCSKLRPLLCGVTVINERQQIYLK